MSKRSNEFRSLSEAMQEMLTENKLQKGIDQIAVKNAWLEVMGQGVMSYTISIELRNKELIVKLSSSTLREELSYGKNKIILMMNENLKKTVINKIKLL